MSSYVKYCKAQAVECARRAKLASSPELAAERRSLGLRWLKLAEKAKATPLGRPREVESAALGVPVLGRPLWRRGDDRILVPAGTHAAIGEDAVVRDPPEGLFVDFFGVGLEHEALARAPAARVHHGMVPRWEFVPVVVSVEIGPQVDVALRAPERTEELAQVFGVGFARHHGSNHEGRIDDLAESELLGEIVGAAEQG